jgi:hypothetical protein
MRAIAGGRNLLLAVSMAARPLVDSRLAALHAAGYRLQAVFADITIEESARRPSNDGQAISEGGFGGLGT